MQQFACVQNEGQDVAYMPLHGFTAADLGYQKGEAVSNMVNRLDDPMFTNTYLKLFEQIWHDPAKLEDVTHAISEHIASVYKEDKDLDIPTAFEDSVGVDPRVYPSSSKEGRHGGLPLPQKPRIKPCRSDFSPTIPPT
jgi:hypothetical protein